MASACGAQQQFRPLGTEVVPRPPGSQAAGRGHQRGRFLWPTGGGARLQVTRRDSGMGMTVVPVGSPGPWDVTQCGGSVPVVWPLTPR